MQTEVEAKFLGINPPTVRAKLRAGGAKLIQPERLMRRKNFDYDDKRLQKVGGWVRVRDEADKVTLSYKQLNDRSLHGTKEVTLTVDEFDKTCTFLTAIGLDSYSYQETKRESWMLDGVEVELDQWPWIPPFIELEGKDEAALKAAAQALGLDWSQALHGSVETAYQAYYNLTEDEIDGWEAITFSPIPDWLEQTRK